MYLRKIVLCVLGILLSGIVQAKNYALLVGVSDYPAQPLEGPVYDVEAIQDVLVSQWDFEQKNVQVLINEQASKNAILAAIDGLYARSSEGDNVFIYFSGHGTSSQDVDIRAPLPTTSGAFIPFDIADVKSKEELVSKLIVGRKDLRPRFEQFDENGRHLFVAIDACYSGNTVRGGFRKDQLPTRHLALSQLVPKSFGADLEYGSERKWEDQIEEKDIYPYRNVFYLGASGEHEKAQDIPSRMISEFETLDSKPHGAFTDSLLRYMHEPSGADSDKDGSVSYAELRQSLQNLMRERGFNHTPQGLPTIAQDEHALAQRGVFLFDDPQHPDNLKKPEPPVSVIAESNANVVLLAEVQEAPSFVKTSHATNSSSSIALTEPSSFSTNKKIKLSLDPSLSAFRSVLAGLEYVEISDLNYDLAILQGAPERYFLTNRSGDLIADLGLPSAEKLKRYIESEYWVQGMLASAHNSSIGMSIEASFIGAGRGSAAIENELIGIEVRMPQGGYLMMLDYQPGGTVNVIYPYEPNEFRLVEPNSIVRLDSLVRVTAPFGRDAVQVVSFANSSAFYDALEKNKKFAFDSDMGKMLSKMLAGASTQKGVVNLELITAPESGF